MTSKYGPNALPLIQSRELFAQGGALPAGLISAPLRRSWERTRAAGLRPRDQALFHHEVSEQQRRRVSDSHRPLIDLAAPDMAHLLRTMNSPNWVVLLTNTQGTIVHALGDHTLAPRRLRLPLVCGRSLLEGEIGSNAPIIAGHEAQPVLLFGDDHYLNELSTFTCAAAPVMGFDGRPAAVLDVTGIDVAADARTLGRVQQTARSIEGRLYEQRRDGLLLRLHEDPRFVGTPDQGLLLLREDGHLLGANSLARQMLGLPPGLPPQSLPTLEDLFDAHSLAMLRRRATDDSGHAGDCRNAMPLQTQVGALFYATLQARSHPPASWLAPIRRPVSDAAVPSMDLQAAGTHSQTVRKDPWWQSAFDKASRVFPHGLPVLIQGETGTGKEWFARALHVAHRPSRPFVAINCAALADSLAEAELFGYVEGAFTGSRKGGAAGRLEQANHGTLFLDEIGDMPAHLQTRLLRVLQERTILRLGGNTETPLDLLVLSASHRDLDALVAAGSFRQDLYFRLNSLTVRLPALRERKDMDALIDQCLGEARDALAPGLRAALHAHSWPGNLRQLSQSLRVAALLAGPGGEITREMLFPESTPAHQEVDSSAASTLAMPPGAAPALPMLGVLLATATQALSTHDGNVSAAARALGVSRTTLYKYLRAAR